MDVIDVFTNIKNIRVRLRYVRNQETGEEETDVCKALEDIKKHEMRKGEKKGLEKGVKQGERLGTIKTLCALVNDGLL